MTSLQRSLFVPFSVNEMYCLVNDVEQYPKFLPWCSAAKVLASDITHMKAMLSISKGGFKHDFSTINTLKENEYITIDLLNGPFTEFSGGWRFTSADSGSVVELELEFEFDGLILGAALSLASEVVVDTLVDAFKKRAYKIYEGR
ncbi:MAG: type II toxin-antitoxin system RatA family toxin [Gammaproteobacteria bacterium]|jgi:ribosome-associated toxin RatA of RatAB toxin-antitoxin module